MKKEKEKRKRGRPARNISAEIRRVYVSLLARGISLAAAAEITGVPARTWADAAKKDPALRPKFETQNVAEIPKDFNLDQELKSVVPEIFYGLRDAARNEKGIARITALNALKTWATENEAVEEPYTDVDAKPEEHGKIVDFARAV